MSIAHSMMTMFRISVRVGEYNSVTDPDCSDESGKCTSVQDFEIEKIISHPDYNLDTKFNDIALIRLNDSVGIDNGESNLFTMMMNSRAFGVSF